MNCSPVCRNGNWSVTVTVEVDGKKRTLMKSIHTDSEQVANRVQSAINDIMTDVETGKKKLPEGVVVGDALFWKFLIEWNGQEKKVEEAKRSVTLASIMKEFVEERAPNLAKTTRDLDKIYQRHVLRFLEHNKTPLITADKADADFFKKLRAWRRSEVSASKTVNDLLSWCSTLCTSNKKYWPSNPLDDVERLKDDADPIPWRTAKEIEDEIKQHDYAPEQVKKMWQSRYYTKQEVEDFLKLARERDEWTFHALVVATFTGCRRSEVARLQWADVSWTTNMIRIKGAKGSRKRKIVPREVAMHPELRAALERQLLKTRRNPWIFPGEDGGQIEPRYLSKKLNALVKDTPFATGKGWHKLRHSLITHMASDGRDQREIDKIVGHTTQAMRERYAHVTEKDKKAAVEVYKDVRIG